MKVTQLDVKSSWRDVANAARTTIAKEAGEGAVSPSWKRRMLLAEHSPIRKLIVSGKWIDLIYFVHTHFVRHKFGVEWWVQTSREDRTGIKRHRRTQTELINMEGEANAQAIINISRKRLCWKASKETRQAWEEFLKELKYQEPELASVCVPDCIYRGWCYEYDSCGYHLSSQFTAELNQYRGDINRYVPNNSTENSRT